MVPSYDARQNGRAEDPDRCDLCQKRHGTPFMWTIISQQQGTQTRTNIFCGLCEESTRHMCTGKAAELLSEMDCGYKVTITQTHDGIQTFIHDKPKLQGKSKPLTKPKASLKSGVVYVIEAEGSGCIKIGHTQDAESRRSQLDTGSPFPLRVLRVIATQDRVCLERLLHTRYARYTVRKEWFNLPTDILAQLLIEEF